MEDEEVERSSLVRLISKNSDKYGNLLVEVMEINKVISITSLTIDTLRKFCKQKKLEENGNEKNAND